MTHEERRLVKQAFKTWIALKCKHEEFFRSFVTAEGFTPEFLATKIAVDVDHSSLLNRLLDGKPPLPEPPPLSHAYPVYPD